jgi:hypothetical protein
MSKAIVLKIIELQQLLVDDRKACLELEQLKLRIEPRVWELAHDGDSMTMIQSPTGELYRIQELGGRSGTMWSGATNSQLEYHVCLALNHFAREAALGKVKIP